jgi:aminoglycoside phosphotransferase (APT) family kinase protein
VVHDGRLAAVIDFGDLTSGDPANDLMPAWLLFDGSARQRFLDAADPEHDPDRRRRGRGWALAWSVACGANLAPHNQLGPFGRRGVARVVDDWHRSP